MNVITATESPADWKLPSANRVGMFGLIGAESAIFAIFIVAYLFYMGQGKSAGGPTASVLHPPIFLSVCLLSSSATIHFALAALEHGRTGRFAAWWLATLALGTTFLAGTGVEWHHLIVDEGLTISSNLFGTTYYSLVGLHAFHVLVGLILMAVVAAFIPGRHVGRQHAGKLEVLSLYWHFVDVVWVVVFTVVYLVGR